MSTEPVRIAFFGTPQIAVWVLEELEKEGIVPALVVTNPDAPQGRKMILTPSPVSVWAETRGITTLKPRTLKDSEVIAALKTSQCSVYVVAAYGKMIPEQVLTIPQYGVLNMHPSLLPKLRGASPIRSALLENINPTGVTIMKLTTGMDEGPILAQEEVLIPNEAWPPKGSILDEMLARKGGVLLAQILPLWVQGMVSVREQVHTEATYATKITKEMGCIDLHDDPYANFLKIQAFDGWPGTYFFHYKNGVKTRVKIIDAEYTDGVLSIKKVIPEGKREIDFKEYMRM